MGDRPRWHTVPSNGPPLRVLGKKVEDLSNSEGTHREFPTPYLTCQRHAEGLSGYGLQGIEKSGMSGRVRTSCRYGDIMLRPFALGHVALPTRSPARAGRVVWSF